jgi:hypothetical protein
MDKSNSFTEYYKTITNLELLEILENLDDYQPSAIEAAKNEISSRQLSDTEISEAKESLIEIQLQRKIQKEKIKAIESKVKSAGNTLIDTLNPIQSGIPTTEKTIRLIVIVFGGLILYEVITEFRMLLVSIKEFPRYPISSSISLLPFFVVVSGTVAFWKRKTIGWIFLTIFLTYTAVGALWILIELFNWRPSGYELVDKLFPKPSLTTHILQLIFVTGMLYVISKKNIREVFLIDKQKMVGTISVTVILTILLLFAIKRYSQ